MEIKVGEYVRTKNGIIAKVTDILEGYCIDCDDDVFDLENAPMMEIPWEYIEEYVVNHSFNIIDLIEVGDIVNDYIVLDIMEDLQTGEIHLEMPSSYPKEGSCEIYNNEIKTILTHEQYERNCYKIN